MTTYFTADTHFGDRHILRQRGHVFGSIAEHDETLISCWNEVVSPSDEIWHVGDFAANTSRMHCADVFARLNGVKRLVCGNHDTNRVQKLPWAQIVTESIRLAVRDNGEEWPLFLAHYAHRTWPGLWRRTRHLYGHSHGALPDTRRSCDVGVDAWNYRPICLANIIARQDAATILPEELPRDAGL